MTLLLHRLFASNNREEQLKPRITKSFSEKCQVNILGFMFSAQTLHSAKRVHTQLATATPWNENNYSKMEKPFLAATLQKETLGQSVSSTAALGVRTAKKEDRDSLRPSLFPAHLSIPSSKIPCGREVERHSRRDCISQVPPLLFPTPRGHTKCTHQNHQTEQEIQAAKVSDSQIMLANDFRPPYHWSIELAFPFQKARRINLDCCQSPMSLEHHLITMTCTECFY